MKFKQSSYIFILENAFKNIVGEMAAILFRSQCVNSLWLSYALRRYWFNIYIYIDFNILILAPVKACCLMAPTLQWRHNEHNSISNHSRVLTQLFVQAYFKEDSKAPHHLPLCGELAGVWWISSRKASNVENVSIWWHHHVDITRTDVD